MALVSLYFNELRFLGIEKITFNLSINNDFAIPILPPFYDIYYRLNQVSSVLPLAYFDLKYLVS